METTSQTLLVIDDDAKLNQLLTNYLGEMGFQVLTATKPSEGLRILSRDKPNLVILDIMLPKKDGFSLAKDLRKENKDIPFIFLTAKTLQEDIIKGLKMGADDYITKPFSTEELLLRIEIIFRRQKSILSEEMEVLFNIGDKYIFDHHNRILKTNTIEHRLTKRESDVLLLLCKQKGKLVKREDALKDIWGENDYFMGRSMDVYITKLRKYLNEDNSISIKNIHGTGFKLEINNSISPE